MTLRKPLDYLILAVALAPALYWMTAYTGPYAWLMEVERARLGWSSGRLTFAALVVALYVPLRLIAGIRTVERVADPSAPAEVSAPRRETWQRSALIAGGATAILLAMAAWWFSMSVRAGQLRRVTAADFAAGRVAAGNLFSKPNGTYTYPTDPAYAMNAADLVEFRVKPFADHTAFRQRLDEARLEGGVHLLDGGDVLIAGLNLVDRGGDRPIGIVPAHLGGPDGAAAFGRSARLADLRRRGARDWGDHLRDAPEGAGLVFATNSFRKFRNGPQRVMTRALR